MATRGGTGVPRRREGTYQASSAATADEGRDMRRVHRRKPPPLHLRGRARTERGYRRGGLTFVRRAVVGFTQSKFAVLNCVSVGGSETPVQPAGGGLTDGH